SQPVVSDGACYFVRPQLGLQFGVLISGSGDPPGLWGPGSIIGTDQREITVGGKAAVSFREDGYHPSFSIYASPHNNLKAGGQVHLTTTAVGTRGNDADSSIPLAASDVEKVHQVT